MFGFGFSKLLLLVIIVAVIWYGFKTIGRQDERRPGKAGGKRKHTADSIDKMDKCPVCGTYVVSDRAANCGRQGCPY
jgi:ribosomal protein L32